MAAAFLTPLIELTLWISHWTAAGHRLAIRWPPPPDHKKEEPMAGRLTARAFFSSDQSPEPHKNTKRSPPKSPRDNKSGMTSPRVNSPKKREERGSGPSPPPSFLNGGVCERPVLFPESERADGPPNAGPPENQMAERREKRAQRRDKKKERKKNPTKENLPLKIYIYIYKNQPHTSTRLDYVYGTLKNKEKNTHSPPPL